MTDLQKKIESYQGLLIRIATSGNRPEEEDNFKNLRTVLISNDEIKNQLPDFVRANRTVPQFWEFIKGKFKTYAERKQFIWDQFSGVLDYLETEQKASKETPNSSNQIVTMKDKLIKILEHQKKIGDKFLLQIEGVSNSRELDTFLADYDNWTTVTTNILNKAYVHKQLFITFSAASEYTDNVHVDQDPFKAKRDRVLYCLPRQLGHLKTAIAHTQTLQNIALLPFDDQLTTIELPQNKIQNMSKLFISHSSQDDPKIKPFIDLIEDIGVPHKQIFYSSHPAYGVGLGENIFARLKTELEGNVFALFMLSENFYKSPVCLCEMGAVWIKSSKQIPILIPPFDYDSIQGVFLNSLGFKLDDKKQLNNFKTELETYFNLTPIHITRWEEKRDKYLSDLANLINY